MFKLKVSVLFALLILLSVLSAFWVVEEQRSEASRKNAAVVQHAREQFRREMRLREVELRDASAALAQGPLRAYLETLDRFREELDRVEAGAYEAVPLQQYPLGDKEGARLREAWVERERAPFLDAFVEALAETREVVLGDDAWKETPRAAFVERERRSLVLCSAYAATNCVFRFTYFPLRDVTEQVRRAWSGRAGVDLALAADTRGVGLADAGNANWSSDRGFADRYPMARAATGGEVVRDVIVYGDHSPSYYLAIATPIRYGRRVLGAMIVGDRVDEQLVRDLSRALGTDVTFLHGDEAIESTLPEEASRTLVGGHDFDPGRREVMNLSTDSLVAVSVPFLGNYSDDGLRAVLSVDLDRALVGYRWIETILVAIGAILLLVGLALIQVLVQSYSRQFERIDEGIHEVISGNRDYEFSFDMPDTLARNMAQSLNLMVAVLEGKPLPDEMMGDGWDESLLIDVHSGNGNGHGSWSQPDGADQSSDVMPAVKPAGSDRAVELLKESAEAYYRRLFREYVDARRTTGEATEKITYPAFVEKLVRNERRLRDKLGCRYVRFEVAVKDEQVMLTPIPIP